MSRKASQQALTDLLVVGSGAGALTAAITAASAGLKVMIAEKAAHIGGTTALSGGFMWIPRNPLMTAHGREDSREAAWTYVSAAVGDRLREDVVGAYLDRAPEAIAFLQKSGAAAFRYLPLSDYKPDLPGAAFGRSIAPQPFDARTLGQAAALLRPPLDFMTAFGGMMLDSPDIAHMLNALRKPASFLHAAKLSLRYGWELLRHGRAMRRTYGNALVASLFKRALDLGVEIRTGCAARELLFEGRAVRGARLSRSGEPDIIVRVRRGVVLAAGGFSSDAELVRRFFPCPDQMQTLCVPEATGDSLRMAEAANAAIDTDLFQNFLGMPMSTMRDAGGGVKTYMHIAGMGRAKPGLVCVDSTGRRFVNEAAPYNDFVHTMIERDAVPAYFIFDHRHFSRHGAGLLRPPAFARPIGKYLRSGYLVRAPTLSGLAAQVSVPAQTLEATIRDYNAAARAGRDPDFAKGDNVFDRGAGDPEHGPNPNMGPIARPPFYAIRCLPGNLGSYVGLRTDADARVLNGQGEPIEGLYACGLDAASIFSGVYPGAGCSIGPGVVFGYIAARHAADQHARYAAALPS